jgi:hypothetical protein
VVLLDFGLAVEVGGAPQSEVNVVGTADYMAPEQAASRPVGPAADWYSTGVLLYESLTGRLPFVGAPLEVLIAKQRGAAPDPRLLAPESPPDLAALCIDLLRTDPAARPTADKVLRRLEVDDPSTEIRLAIAPPRAQAPFVGRAVELEALAEAFQATRLGQPVTVFVEGESGVGKSALVRRFVELVRAEQPGAVVLTGRCYERESVPYKALDGIIDALAQYMTRLVPAQAATLLPLRVGLLAQVFPVLRRVELIDKAPERLRGPGAPGAPMAIDPLELRARVFAALRELLLRLCEQHPLALMIDDLQWADADSRALLAEVLHPPDAPPLLLVATVRQSAAPDGIDPLGFASGDVRRVAVERLPPGEARELAAQLIGRAAPGLAKGGDDEARAIAEEAAGHPLFIDELVRHALHPSGDTTPSARLHLEEALWARIRRFDPPSRRLLALVTLAAGPLSLETAALALSEDPSELERQVALLRGANLVRSLGQAAGAAVEAYHDRVRAAVFLHLEEAEARALHERLARALESSHHGAAADPEALSTHWRAAGDDGRAALYAVKAAEAAAGALAFDRAARLYRLSLELEPNPGPAACELFTHLGEALANIGRGGDAALAFLEGAKRASPIEALDLQRRAAQQLLVSGHIDEGLSGLRMVLASVGLALAETPRRALASLMLRRAHLRLRGVGFREREAASLPDDELRQVDICWSVAVGLGMVDPVRGSDFQTRHVLLALAAGEPYRVARALAMEGAFVSVAGQRSDARAQALLGAAEQLAERIAHPHALGLCRLGRAVNHFLNGRWREALDAAAAGLEIFRDRCTDVTWEVNISHQFMMQSLALMGSVGELSRRMPRLRRQARERGDLYAGILLRSSVVTIYSLAADEPERTRQEITESFAKWSQQGFHLQHYWELASRVYCDLYTDDGRTALDRLTARWPVLSRSQVLRIQSVRIEALDLRGRARLVTAARLLPSDPERRQLIDGAARDAREIERLGATWARPMGQLLSAGVAVGRGEVARATAILDEAVRGFEAGGMAVHAAAARRRRGQLLGGGEGARLVAEADQWMTSERVKNPRRLAALLAPEFPDGNA